MARNTYNQPNAQAQFDELPPVQRAQLAFECHSALMRLQVAQPDLMRNPYFDQIRIESYQRFLDAWRQSW